MTVDLKRQLFTVAEYYKMAEVGIIKPTDRVELINGDIIHMSPIKSTHAGIVDFLVEILVVALHGKFVIKGQNPLRLSNISEPEPDIVVAKFKKDRYTSKHPRPKDVFLLIEVSDSTLETDRRVKSPLYAKAGIPEYWIINIPDKQIEVYRNPKEEKYTTKKVYKKSQKVKCESIDFEIKVSDIL